MDSLLSTSKIIVGTIPKKALNLHRNVSTMSRHLARLIFNSSWEGLTGPDEVAGPAVEEDEIDKVSSIFPSTPSLPRC